MNNLGVMKENQALIPNTIPECSPHPGLGRSICMVELLNSAKPLNRVVKPTPECATLYLSHQVCSLECLLEMSGMDTPPWVVKELKNR